MRHAKYDGWLISFVENEIENDIWTSLRVYTRARSKRMKDIQFLSELFLIVLKGSVQGFDQDGLNVAYAQYDNIDEQDNEIDGDGYIGIFNYARDFLLKIENHNNVISTYSRDFKDFYSLWSVIVLDRNKLTTPEKIAERYIQFMEDLQELKHNESLDPEEKEKNVPLTFSPEVQKYYQNSSGANTEYPQRQARYEALSIALLP